MKERGCRELEGALQVLALLPGAGTPTLGAAARVETLLPAEALVPPVIYTFDEELLVVRAMWGALRERELHVTVVDAKTKKPSDRVLVIVDATRIFRGQATVPLADAALQKGESVAVTVDHDKPGDEAITVRLEQRR